MAPRSHRAPIKTRTGFSGGPQLTLARVIVFSENIARIFAAPLMLAGSFLVLAMLGVFAELYPWAHLVALLLFAVVFFRSLGLARRNWRPVSESLALRRVEEATGLSHRPFDVLSDRPVVTAPGQQELWQTHLDQARASTQHLRWPKWKLNFADKDPYALRYALLVMIVFGAMFGWGALGSRVISAINPALGKWRVFEPTLNAWITPPDYTHIPPIMIATPAGVRHAKDTIAIPDGSVITAHMAEKDGETPELIVNGKTIDFTTDDEHDFGAEQVLHGGDRITIRRGWQTLGSWNIEVIQDNAPQIALSEPPMVSERKSIRLSYTASDDFGVASVAARIIPRESLPGISNDPILIPLATPDAKQVSRISFEDLTSHPLAGTAVQIQLVAADALGHVAQTEPVDFTLPERSFAHPVARALIEERKKLLQTPDDENIRNEAANIMAGIAHQPVNYRGDPVVLMALRSGAVRLVLDRGDNAIEPVAGLMWQSAVRIEDGATGLAEQNLRKAQKDLAEALDRNASEDEVQQLISKLREALSQYLSELATHMAARPGPAANPLEDLSQILGPQTNMLTPQDLEQMLGNMRNLSATGNREQAREELSRMQQLLENLHTGQPQLSEGQKQALQNMVALRALQKQQQQLLDKTFRSRAAGNAKASKGLASEQNNLLRQLQNLMRGLDAKAGQHLERGAQAMHRAEGQLGQGNTRDAVPQQSEAVKALQESLQGMADDLRSSMMQLPMPGMGRMRQGQDPFGRGMGVRDDGSVKLPDQMQVRRVQEILDELQRRSGDRDRPRIERDYIERLLQNF